MNDLSGKKIGILGGSFDPIHNGHLAIAKAAYTDFRLDEVWFIPAGHSPNKNENAMTSPQLRAEMVALAIKPYPYFKLSTMEIEAEQTSYTYLTLTNLKNRYPDTSFYFIMGADSLDYFEEWRHPEIICEKAAVLVAVRDHWDIDDIKKKINAIEKQFDAAIYPLSCGRFDAASRDIRQQIKNGVNADQLLPDSVIRFIKEHQLYESRK